MADITAALLSSGVLQRFLLPRLLLADLLCLERTSTAFGVLLESASKEEGEALQHLATQRAIRTQDCSTASADAGTSIVSDVSCSGDLVAVFCEVVDCHLGYFNFGLFNLTQKEPLHHLCLDAYAGHERGFKVVHEWSPDGTQLALFWPCDEELQVAWLSHSEAAERQIECRLPTALRFSPCSRLLCLYTDGFSPDLLVLNAQLETVFDWPEEEPDSEDWEHALGGMFPTWTPSSSLMIATRIEDFEEGAPVRPPQLEACWHETLEDPGDSDEAALVSEIIKDLKPGQVLAEMAWGPTGGLAALVQIHGKRPGQYKLYVLLPDGPKVSTALVCCGLELAPDQHAAILWSPVGTRLIIDGGGSLRVLTPACKRILKAFKHWQTNAAFDPSGRFLAAVCCGRVLYCPTEPLPNDKLSFSLYSATDGALRFSQVIDSPPLRGRLCFSSLGDQLVLAGGQGIHIVSFGQAHKASQLCDAIAGACTWASEKFQEQSEDEGMCSASGSEAPRGDVEDAQEAMQLCQDSGMKDLGR